MFTSKSHTMYPDIALCADTLKLALTRYAFEGRILNCYLTPKLRLFISILKSPSESYHDRRNVGILMNAKPFLSLQLGNKERGPGLRTILTLLLWAQECRLQIFMVIFLSMNGRVGIHRSKVLSQLHEIYYCTDVNTAGFTTLDIALLASVVQSVTHFSTTLRKR
jgi:hypothetical protein